MNFKDVLKEDNDIFLNANEFAETILYNGIERTARFELAEQNKKGNSFDTDGYSDVQYFYVQLDKKPKIMDEIQYNFETYQVTKIVEKDNDFYKVETVINERPFHR